MATMDLSGKSLGNYQILNEIGRGGMAVVYRAFQPSLNRHVAIKVLPPQLALDQQFIHRFVREARSAAKLRHPNIVVVYDVAQQDGLYYIVMELLQGLTLQQLIEQQGALPLVRAARIAHQIAAALDYAHQQGFVHRDIKPSNIFVGPGDHVTLTDFGIAKAASETQQLTRTGMLMGTPEYMSPEQAAGSSVDHRTDLYALGVLIYEMVSGRLPFTRTTPHATLHAVIYEPPAPLRQINPQLSPGVESVVLKALAKRPEDRFQSGQALATAFDRARTGPTVRAPAAGRPPTKTPTERRLSTRTLALAFGIIAVLLIILGAALLLLSTTKPAPATASPDQTQTEALTSQAGIDIQATAGAATETALGSRLATETALARDRERQTATAEAAQRQATLTTAAMDEKQAVAATQTAASLEATLDAVAAATAAALQGTQETIAATQTAVAQPTVTHTPAPTLTPTKQPTPSPTPGCALVVDPQLIGAWDRSRIGCPTASASITWAAWEPFERGYMLWRDDVDQVYVFRLEGGTNLGAGQWQQYTDKWDGSNPEGVGLSPPPGLNEPIRGFGWLWRTKLGGPDSQIGWARDEEKGFCANIQPFEAGLLMHSSTVGFCLDRQSKQQYNRANDPTFSPLLFALYGDNTWRRY